MDNKVLFSQTFVGALVVAVLGGVIVWLITSRDIVRVEIVNAAAITTPPPSYASGPETVRRDAPVPRSPTVTGTRVGRSCSQAVIDDPDGYTNVRRGPDTTYEVVTRIIEDEVFCVTSQSGRWWTVRTADGVTGYVYYDRVRVIPSS